MRVLGPQKVGDFTFSDTLAAQSAYCICIPETAPSNPNSESLGTLHGAAH